GPVGPGKPARCLDPPGPETSGRCFGHIERAAVRRQSDPVRSDQRIGNLTNHAAIALRLIDRALIELAALTVAVIGEIEAAMAVEDDVVGRQQRIVAAAIIETLDLTRCRIDPLDPSARIVLRLADRPQALIALVPGEAPIVANIEQPI